jgi:low temperature requirement protein LtrA
MSPRDRARQVTMDDEYSRKLLTYSILVVIAAVFTAGSPILFFIKLPGAAALTLGIVAIVLFIYATAWFGSYLKLDGPQWVAAVSLALLAYVGSVIYMITRQPDEAHQRVSVDAQGTP